MSVVSIVSSAVIVVMAFAVEVRCCDISYPVALDNMGPRPCHLPHLTTVHSTPVLEKPIIRLPALVPSPQTLSNRCRCLKTVVKPQVIHQLINVPSVQRYIETRHTPVIEKIHYNAHPVGGRCCEPCGYYRDDDYSDSCCCCLQQDVCTIPVAAAMPVTTSVPVRTAVPVAAGLPVRRMYPVAARCFETC